MRYFKILTRYRCVANIICADSLEKAYDLSVAEHGWEIKIVECDRKEWHDWRVMDWNQVDQLENDMVSTDSF